MANERVNISITEEFLIRNMLGYDEYEPSMREIMANQNHVDIRTFAKDSEEEWTTGTYGVGTEVANFHRLSLSITAGNTESSSITVKKPVDLLTGFESTDVLSLALPSFPLTHINTATSFIDFTSNPEGNFIVGPTVSIAFSTSTTTLTNGNSEFRVPRSVIEINELDLEKITAIRFRITGTGTATLLLMALRLLDSKWTQGPVDYDNWNGRWTNTPPSTGNVANPATFNQPILWRSADPPGEDDPRPIDSELGIIFYTGQQEHNNSFTLYLREVSEAFLTQLDIDGTTQSELDGKPQPDLGVSEYAPRLMTDMDRFDMEILDAMDMYSIERVSDPVYTGWIQFTLQWGQSNHLAITNSSAPGYIFENLPALNANSRYLLICSLEGTSARATIHEVNKDYSINPVVIFDTTLIDDDNLFKRRKGRVGWQTSLGDNNAYIDHIRVRSLNFAEYRSAPLTSITPVKGAKLFTDFTQDTQLWEGFEAGPENTEIDSHISRDAARSTTGESYRLDVYGSPNQGFLSNPLPFTDFSQAEISFDLWYPSALVAEANALGQIPGIKLQLVGLYENPTFEIHLPTIQTEQWQHISGIDLSIYALNQTGKYFLLVSQPSAAAGSWWIDNVKVFQRAIQWSARSVASNPWESNYAPWTDFRTLVNSETNGIMFSVQGKELQLRARALRQDANIVQPPKIIPTYAELGRLIWPENSLKGLTPPTAEFSTSPLTPFAELPILDPLTETASNYYSVYHWSELPWAVSPLVAESGGAKFKSFGTQTGSYLSYKSFKGNSAVSVRRAYGADLTERFWELWLCLNAATHSGYRALFTLITEESWKAKLFSVASGVETKLGESASAVTVEENQQFGLLREGNQVGAYYKNPSGVWTNLVSATNNAFTEGYTALGGQGSDPSFLEYQAGEINPVPELTYQFVSASTPGSGAIILYEWTFGDGARATGATATHTYQHHGTYQVTLTITDRYGQQAQLTKPLVI